MASPSESPPPPQGTENRTSPTSVDTTEKRKRVSGAEGRKRDHYVSRACEACKRRKQRCDGMVPCRRCHRAGVECVYLKPVVTPRKKSQKEELRPWDPEVRPGGDVHHLTNLLSSMQKKIDSLNAKLKEVDEHAAESRQTLQTPHNFAPPLPRSAIEPQRDRSRLRPQARTSGPPSEKPPLPDYHGPTSSRFPLGMARNLLQQIAESDDLNSVHANAIPYLTSENTSPDEPFFNSTRLCPVQSLTILESIGWDETSRLVGVFEECLWTMHPILDLNQLHQHVSIIFTTIYGGGELEEDAVIDQDDVNNLKLVLAVASLAERAGESELATALYESTREELQLRILGNKIDLNGQILLCLAGIYHFFQDQARIASRMVAIVARMTLESGLQNREVLFHTFPDKETRNKAITVLWTIFIFDRQFAFAAGLPQTMQDSDMDVPTPDNAPYILAMSSYVKFGSKAWEACCDSQGRMKASCSNDTLDFIEYQVQQWQKSLPVELQPDALLFEYSPAGLKDTPAVRCMRTILFLRANQVRLLVMRGILFSPALAVVHRNRVMMLLERAKETVRVLVRLDASGDIYRTHQVIFNHFLASALTVLCLFLAHEPRQRNSKACPYKTEDFLDCRDGIALAFDLVKKYAVTSGSSRRVWKAFSGLKDLLARLGFLRREESRPPAPVGLGNVTSGEDQQMTEATTSQPGMVTNMPVSAATAPLDPKTVPEGQIPYDLTEFFNLLDPDPFQADTSGLLAFAKNEMSLSDLFANGNADSWSVPAPGANGYSDAFNGGGGSATGGPGVPEFSWMFQDML